MKDKSGAVVELKCTHDPETLTEHPKGRPKPKGVVQWVSAKYGTPCTVRRGSWWMGIVFRQRMHVANYTDHGQIGEVSDDLSKECMKRHRSSIETK